MLDLRSAFLLNEGSIKGPTFVTRVMTTAEFEAMLGDLTDEQLLGPCLLEEIVPFVFDPKPETWETFRDELAGRLDVARADIRIVGSARFGFSLKPGRNLRGFSDRSDIDVVVVSQELFDNLWYALLQAAYPRPPITEKLGGWVQQRRNEIYTGWLTPRDIQLNRKIFGAKAQPVLDFKLLWFTALKEASRHPVRRHEDVNGRLYRSWQHVEFYHLHSLAALRRDLTE